MSKYNLHVTGTDLITKKQRSVYFLRHRGTPNKPI